MKRWMSVVGITCLLASACGGSVTRSTETDGADDETSASNGSGNGSGNNNSGNNNSGNNNSGNNNSGNNNSGNNSGSTGSGGETFTSSGSVQATAVTTTVGVGTVGGVGGSSAFGGSGGWGGTDGFGGGDFGGSGGWGGDIAGTFGSASVTGGGGNVWEGIPIPPECQGWVNNEGNRYCEMELDCPNEWAWSYCDYDAPNYNCECESDRAYGEYQISGVGIEDACPWTAAVCVQGANVMWESEVCTPSYQEQSPDYCNAEAQCTSTSTFSSGDIKITKREWVSSYCEQIGSTWECTCDRPDRQTNLLFSEFPQGATCLNVLDWCNGGDIEPLGSGSCTPVSQSAGTDYCDAQLDCSYDVLVGGVEAAMHERLPLNCSRNADGLFNCQCAGSAGSFGVMSTDAWNACSEASSICAQTP